MKKKILSIAMASVMMLSLAACGNNSATVSSSDVTASVETSTEDTQTSTETTTTTEASVSAETNTETSAEATVTEETTTKLTSKYLFTNREKFIPDNAASNYAANLTIGWNLGNTFDAHTGSKGLAYETYWQKDKTTPELMQALKEAGFNTIRIPVSWHNHVDSNNQIDKEWMDRVQEVVDYCMDNDLYVILNTHHDVSKFYIYPTNQYRAQSNKYLKDVWEQIAERFKDYDEKLMFESMNETRLVDEKYEWYIDASADICKEAIDCINDYNQTFVDVVRKSGGNNATRFLVIPGYCTSPEGITNNGFVMPTDPSNEDPHLILTVHSYSPYDFALNANGTSSWSSKQTGDTLPLNDMMVTLYAKYVKLGIPVIIDEFGNVDKNNEDARIDHAAYFVGLARSYGMSCVWWDNNNRTSSGEKFTIIDRKNCKVLDTELVEAMMREAYAETK